MTESATTSSFQPFTISVEDTAAFAELSGDYNPLHVNPTAARRLIFGRPVPHGVHVLLAGLERVLSGFRHPRICKLKASFSRPARHGEPLTLEGLVRTGNDLQFAIRQNDSQLQSIAVSITEEETANDPTVADSRYPARNPEDLQFDQLSARSGKVPLGVDRKLLHSLLPVLARLLPTSQIAVLLASTRIIGMECPGLRSIFADLSLTFDDSLFDNPATLVFRTLRVESRMSLIRLEFCGAGARGEATALFRPEPVLQLSAASLSAQVHPGEFSQQHALIIGGSRGLGEVTAKLLSMGGAQVAITFAHGSDDAERVVSEIVSCGGRCTMFHFDVREPRGASTSEQGAPGFRPTHLYFFATPPIQIVKGRPFNYPQFQEYCGYYVGGLVRTMRAVDQLFSLGEAPLTLFYPSTVFLDEIAPGAAEYVAAKAAGEVVCRMLARTRPALRVRCPRLCALRTDQTNNFGAKNAAEPAPVLLDLFREMR